MKKYVELLCLGLFVLLVGPPAYSFAVSISQLSSPDGKNTIMVADDDEGGIYYRVFRKGQDVLLHSPMGLITESDTFDSDMLMGKESGVTKTREKYELKVGNHLDIDTEVHKKEIVVINNNKSRMIIELVATNDGVAFRYKLPGKDGQLHSIKKELTTFALPQDCSGWLQPYHAAGPYTPAYEDFFFKVTPGTKPPRSRENARGWCFPALFQLEESKQWVFIAETDVNGSYCATHLEENAKGIYQVAFAYEDERTSAKKFNPNAEHTTVQSNVTPWRIIIIADEAKDIAMSTMVTDLASPSKIEDTSWIKTGRASWAWWSHPDGPANEALFNEFTDLADEYGWEYTLFDAGWWNPGLKVICDYAESKKVIPLVWLHAGDFYRSDKRERKLDEVTSQGGKGVKVDFWCSDRQEAMAAMQGLFKACADEKLVVNLHGCTIPRGWHRTWPNLLTAEAVLGTESYFYETRYPEKAAELNCVLPFTRNVMAPMDTTPIAITERKYPHKTTAAHELATSIIFTSGIIHYADSTEVFRALPAQVKQLLKDAPAVWPETRYLVAQPGELVVVARRLGDNWVIAGINGTNSPQQVNLDLNEFGKNNAATIITEGQNALTSFNVKQTNPLSQWTHRLPAYGGFVLRLTN